MNRLHHFSQFAVSAAAIAVAAAAITVAMHNLSGAADAMNPTAGTLVVDKHAITEQSKLGQDIRRQILAYEDKVEADLGAEGQALRNESQALQKDGPFLAPAVRDKKIAALRLRQSAYQEKVQDRQELIMGGQLAAGKFYDADLDPILHAIMVERGANILLFKSSVADSAGDVDITREAVARLDKKISSFKVPLVKPPANNSMMPMPMRAE